MDRTGLEFHFVFAKTRTVHTVILTTFMVAELRLPVYLRPPIHEDATGIVRKKKKREILDGPGQGVRGRLGGSRAGVNKIGLNSIWSALKKHMARGSKT